MQFTPDEAAYMLDVLTSTDHRAGAADEDLRRALMTKLRDHAVARNAEPVPESKEANVFRHVAELLADHDMMGALVLAGAAEGVRGLCGSLRGMDHRRYQAMVTGTLALRDALVRGDYPEQVRRLSFAEDDG